MYIIDATYFNRDKNIPNINEVQTEAYDIVNSFCDELGRQLLRDALGNDLFNDFDTYVVAGVFDNSSAPQKWIDFVEGKEYIVNDVSHKWSGLISTQGVFKKSLITDYVYAKWLEFNFTTQSGVGEVTLNPQNANIVNPTQNIVRCWNNFLEMYQGNTLAYPSIYYNGGSKVVDWYGGTRSTNVSLLSFLQDNETDYPNADLRVYEFKNQLGV